MQKGFATLEVILMVMVIGILASIAVPRFTAVTTAANTAKIQSDLSTIDTAIAIYIMENGTSNMPTAPSGLSNYLREADNIKPPTGQCYVNGETKEIPANTDYTIGADGNTGEYRAFLKIENTDRKAGDFSTTKTSNGTGSGDSDSNTDATPTTGN